MNLEKNKVTIKGKYNLKGSLTIPKSKENKYPAVLIIQGSGDLDRDGNKKKLKLDIYKNLANIISKEGFATLRYDKRGCGESEGNYFETGFWDLVDDAEKALTFLKNHPKIDKDNIIIIGHSEGAIIAPTLYQRQRFNGLILLSGAKESIGNTIKRQLEDTIKEIDSFTGIKGFIVRLLKVSDKIRKQNKKLIKKILESSEDVIKFKGRKVNAKWMREHYNYNVERAFKDVECKTLVLVGDKDIQVVPEQSKEVANDIKGPSEYHIIKDMNHILKKDPKSNREISDVKKYKKMKDRPMDKELITYIKEWLKKFK
ncbi:MAG: alpha/beta hydrolase [Firmicutes bacterium]|nr:alpha/beta hydrolase [Bacillota bacterium]